MAPIETTAGTPADTAPVRAATVVEAIDAASFRQLRAVEGGRKAACHPRGGSA
jgi:hypothetical protein